MVNVKPNQANVSKGLSGQQYEQMTFMYFLELNNEREIIGGIWTMPNSIKGLRYKHQWSNIIKPLAVYYADEVSTPNVGDLYSVFESMKQQ